MRYETKDSIWHPDIKTRLEFWSKIHSLGWKSTQGSIVRYATRDSVWQVVLKGQDLNSYQKSILKSSFIEKRKQNSIVRFLKKDPIWHLDLKTKLEFFKKIHSFKWKSKQDFIVRYATKASIGHLDLKGQHLNVAVNETANKIPLWDMWQKIQFDI